jgi:hypothetical protein
MKIFHSFQGKFFRHKPHSTSIFPQQFMKSRKNFFHRAPSGKKFFTRNWKMHRSAIREFVWYCTERKKDFSDIFWHKMVKTFLWFIEPAHFWCFFQCVEKSSSLTSDCCFVWLSSWLRNFAVQILFLTLFFSEISCEMINFYKLLRREKLFLWNL